jgi:hypothetical protein
LNTGDRPWYLSRKFQKQDCKRKADDKAIVVVDRSDDPRNPSKVPLTWVEVRDVIYTPGFSKGPLGKNMVGHFLKDILALAGCPAHVINNHTNHSLRATYITFGLKAGIPIQELMKRTGHKTEKGIMNYKRNDVDSDTAMNIALMAGMAGRQVQLENVAQALADSAAVGQPSVKQVVGALASAQPILADAQPQPQPQLPTVQHDDVQVKYDVQHLVDQQPATVTDQENAAKRTKVFSEVQPQQPAASAPFADISNIMQVALPSMQPVNNAPVASHASAGSHGNITHNGLSYPAVNPSHLAAMDAQSRGLMFCNMMLSGMQMFMAPK